jgi:hypothetical protein
MEYDNHLESPGYKAVVSWSYGSWIYNYLGNQCLSPHNIIEFKIYKDATSFDITGLKPSSSYSFQLFTKYGTDDNFVMSEPVTMSMTTFTSLKWRIYYYY